MTRLSIVIPCHNDIRIGQCLSSIDAEVEVVVSLNGHSDAVLEIVQCFARSHEHTVVVQSPTRNLAAALQAGSVAASGDTILYMDSDCRFLPGTIARFKEAARSHEVVKGAITFEARSWIDGVIARTREHHTAEQVTAYKPPLAIAVGIKNRIGGYYFDRRLIWREDSDLDHRIRRAGIPIHYEATAGIVHPPLTVIQDLTSAYRYGVGLARARWFRVSLTEVPRSVVSTLRSKGVVPAIFMILRNRVYDLGTAIECCRLWWGAKP